MTRKPKNLTAYRKERKRILDFISRRKRSGYVQVSEIATPQPMKAPTKRDVERLRKQYSAEKLSEKFGYVTPTGEVLTGKAAVSARRKESARKHSAERTSRSDYPSPDEIDYGAEEEQSYPLPDEVELVFYNFKEKLERFGFVDESGGTFGKFRYRPDMIQAVRDATYDILSLLEPTYEVMLNVYNNQEELENEAYVVQNYLERFNQAYERIIEILTGRPETLYEKALRGDIGIDWDEPS